MSTPGLTQRWRNGTHRWRTAAGHAFKPDRYGVSELDSTMAEEFCVRHHYSAAWPATKYRFGLFDLHAYEPQLVGVVALGIPMSNQVLTNPFPTLVPNEESLELSRLVLLDSVALNGESWFCASVFVRAVEHGVRGLVSFADPVL
ncbi:hypothetical protein SAMN05421810_1188 [Amycolatopsis arida]|uniref:Uncharacterized protein n=1 Tax=Amycolatopsis arida TaxID=587909 RepID=A0A1I6B0I9_9PSEU|nr:hypothetical protein [Amycolatopsis arida]TDX83588.1 hypothetical protein CLV69_11922 [Amycolatopsis arida]SFQ74472.1 hypothetical protein SAMN05421810_1188 [Amycolatopsis arida]